MAIGCIAIVGVLCVSLGSNLDSFKVEHQETGLYGTVTFSGDGWEVGQTLHSDCIGCGPDKKLFAKTCDGDVCVSYYRRCDDADRPTICEYYFDGYPPVDIAAKSEEVFRGIVDSVGVKSPKGVLLFSKLTQEGHGDRNRPPLTNYLRSGDSR